jgi:TolA-binding protein
LPSPSPSPSLSSDSDLDAYRHAHSAHFRGSDATSALALWDSYLALYPSGRFAAEARYNRAIALVKLGRKAEATSALAPFARGEVDHGYRQHEAAKLVDALGPQ